MLRRAGVLALLRWRTRRRRLDSAFEPSLYASKRTSPGRPYKPGPKCRFKEWDAASTSSARTGESRRDAGVAGFLARRGHTIRQEHRGKYWIFPTATSVPKPLQRPHPRIWVAARDPGTYEWALANGCSIMSWAISRPFAEVEKYKGRFEAALKAHPQPVRPSFLTMRHTAVYARPEQWELPVNAVISQSARFENRLKNLGGVKDGFPEAVDLSELGNRAEYAPALLRENLMFGTPEEVIEKLKRYDALGVDYFNYSANFGLPLAEQKKSLRLFIDEVMPAFAGERRGQRAASG